MTNPQGLGLDLLLWVNSPQGGQCVASTRPIQAAETPVSLIICMQTGETSFQGRRGQREVRGEPSPPGRLLGMVWAEEGGINIPTIFPPLPANQTLT